MQQLRDIANKLRVHSIRLTTTAGSGHPTSSCSCADLLSVLFFRQMRYHVNDPRNVANDRFVLSKGHACPALYSVMAENGHVAESQLADVRKFTSDLEGHPTPRLDFIDVATGSLGMGLSFAAGMAYMGKHIEKAPYRVYCLMGDGEVAEGGVWEAFSFSSFYKLDNLVAIIDVNRLGQSDPTMFQHDTEIYRKRIAAFGWNAIVCDGLDIEDICKAFDAAQETKDRPTCLIAKSFKGAGIGLDIEDKMGWHGKPLPKDKADMAIEAISKRIENAGPHGVCPPLPGANLAPVDISSPALSRPPPYKLGEKLATRAAYGQGLKALGEQCDRVLALDGDVKNSSMSITFQKAFPDRFVECYIAEQNMVGAAVGMAVRDRAIVFVSSFSAFFSRAYDHIRMAAVSFSNINICGSHAGCSIGADGPSQMALEDLAMFRAIPNCTIFYPTDAVACERAVELAARTKGICFIRTTRAETPIVYEAKTEFAVGKAHVISQSDSDKVTIVAAGITLPEARTAADQLGADGINVRIIDPFTIKPLDVATLTAAARATGGRVVTVEDHYPEGGLGEAVMSALADQPGVRVRKLAVTGGIPRSGTPAQLLDAHGISARCVVEAVKDLLK